MKVKGKFLLANVERRASFSDPTKHSNVVLFLDGGDTLTMYINDDQYIALKDKPLYVPYQVELNYKPFAQKVAYCMDLLSVTDCK